VILWHLIFGIVFQFFAYMVLDRYESEVRVLQPWQRNLYYASAFVAGALIALKLFGWRRCVCSGARSLTGLRTKTAVTEAVSPA